MDKNLPYLLAGFLAWWLVLTLYCVHLFRKTAALKRELDALREGSRPQ